MTHEIEILGLSSADAAAALLQHGPNDLRPPQTRAWLRRAGRILSEPTLLALLAVLALYLMMGSAGEAALLGVFVALVLSITYVEEGRTEHAVEALGQFASPRAVALRDGAWARIAGIEVVPGDLLRLAEGDRVPADVELLDAHDLRVDESLLSGESAAVWKRSGSDGDDSRAWAGSRVLGGQGLARVRATGLQTKVGQLSKGLSQIQADPTPFQRAAEGMVRWLGWIAAAACLAVVVLGWRSGLGWAPALLQGLTLAIAVVPEELPVILTVFMAMGSRRLASQRVLVQRLPAVETLGAISLLAVDKTGTLTANRMELRHVLPAPGADEAALLAAAARACEPDPFDPMERALLERAGAPGGELLKEYELQGLPPRMAHLWSGQILSMKGGLEGVLEHCSDPQASAWARDAAVDYARQGLRVLGVAEGVIEGRPEALPKGLRLLGLVAFHDPLREGIPAALARCRAAGIRVVMLTGDGPETAKAIAAQAGFLRADRVALGSDLDDPAQAARLAAEVDVFARMAPQHKQTLIKHWSASGEVVAMGGDGVNDAPALAQAHVGVAMGQRGTDVAREAAGVVLVDDSFTSLVEGVRLGRETTQRILRAAVFVLAVHVPIVGLVLLCLLLGLPPLVSAAQVAFLELFIGPACSVVFERGLSDDEVMNVPPRDPRAPFLARRQILQALAQGAILLAVIGTYYAHGIHAGAEPQRLRSLAFTALMIGDLALAWTLLSPAPFWKRERWAQPWYWGVAAGVMGLLELLRWLPISEGVLGMPPLNAAGWMEALALGWASVLWFEGGKLGKKA